MLALLLRTCVALALAAPPPTAPAGREYTGADGTVAPETDAPPAADPPAAGDPPPGSKDPPQSEPIVPAPPGPPQLPAVDAPADAPAVEGPEEDDADEPAYDPRVDSPEAIRARHWVRSGIVFMVVGGALTIGAIAMSQAAVNNPETGAMPCTPGSDPAGNGCTRGGRSRATAALAVPGALMLGGGIAMLTVGKLQQRRIAASVQADRRGFQLGVTLKF